jgi:hypothetical protein
LLHPGPATIRWGSSYRRVGPYSREDNGRLPITLARVYQQSTSRKSKCYCRLGGGLPRAVRNVEAKRHSRRSVPSRLFPLSDMSVIPSAWNSRSGSGCNLPEVRSRMRLPNPRCAAMLVYNGPGEPRILTRSLLRRENTAYARRDKLSHSSAGTTVRGLLQAQGEASSAQLEQLLLYVSAHVIFRIKRLTRPAVVANAVAVARRFRVLES